MIQLVVFVDLILIIYCFIINNYNYNSALVETKMISSIWLEIIKISIMIS